MLIQVQYPDNRFDYVKDHMLHGLIESKRILRFKRSSGWVTLGVDPVRQYNRGFHSKPIIYQKPVVEVNNLIRVVYDDMRHDYVSNDKFDDLLELNKVVKFMRTTGWVTVGLDPVGKVKRENNHKYPNELKKRAFSI